MARPKKDIDYETVEKLASIQCTQEEIANFLNLSVRTLQRDDEFCRIYKKGMDNGKMSLRRTQFKLAEKNTSMAIWLGKQYLGQKDNNEIITSKDTPNLKIQIVNNEELESEMYEDSN
jgi:hypothetical protein